MHQCHQSGAVAQIVAVTAHMDAGQHRFLVASGGQRLNFSDDLAQVAALAFAAGNGGDAEGAFVVAAILHFDEGAGIAGRACQKFTHDRFLVKQGQVDAGLGVEHWHEVGFLFVDDDAPRALHFAQFFRGDGGVTAGEQDFGGVVLAVDATGHAAGVFGRFGRHGAGIDDHFIGNGRFRDNLMTGGN